MLLKPKLRMLERDWSYRKSKNLRMPKTHSRKEERRYHTRKNRRTSTTWNTIEKMMIWMMYMITKTETKFKIDLKAGCNKRLITRDR